MYGIAENFFDKLARYDLSLTTCFMFLLYGILATVRSWMTRPKHKPPGPRGLPVIGVLPFLTERPDIKIMEWAKTYGGVMSLPFINNEIVVISTIEQLKAGPVHKSEDYGDRPYCFFHDDVLMRNGIASINVSMEWKEQRRFTLTSMRKFGFGRKVLVNKIVQETDLFCEEVKRNGSSFSVTRGLLTELNANVIAQLCLNRRFDKKQDAKFLRFFHEVSKRFNDASFALQATVFMPWVHRLPPFKKVLQSLKSLFTDFDANLAIELQKHVENFDENCVKDFSDDYIKEMKQRKEKTRGLFHLTTLHFILRDFFLAGTETMASTLTWALLILCNRKETVLKMVHEEIDRVIGKGESPTADHRQSMHYTMAFLQELLRYRTILPFSVARSTSCNTVLGNFQIAKGTTVIENLYAVHNDENLWNKPEVFNVERHLDDDGKFVKSPNVIPFGVGIRYCIGRQLAEVQMFIVLVRILQKFSLQSDAQKAQSEVPAKGGFVTMVSFDTEIQLTERA